MAIVQVSKIIHRSGNIDSLPQLDGAEFGLAVDTTSSPGKSLNRLFIGPIVPVVSNSAPIANNIEILTQYSTISGISNGNSSVNIPIANGNINLSVAGNSNIAVITGTGANINGYLTVTGAITTTVAGSRGDSSFTPATAASGVSPLVVTSTRTVANLFTDGAERSNVQLVTAGSTYHLLFSRNGIETYSANSSFYGDRRTYANTGITYDTNSAIPNLILQGNLISTNANITTDIVIGNSLTVGTDLYVSGNLVYVNVQNLLVEDTFIELARDGNGIVPPDTYDRGVVMNYSGGLQTFMGYDSSAGEFILTRNTIWSNASNLVVDTAASTLGNLRIDQLFTNGANIVNLSGNYLNYNYGNIGNGNIVNANGTNLTYTNANITNGNITNANGTNLTYTNANITNGNITNANGTNLTYTNGTITNFSSPNANITGGNISGNITIGNAVTFNNSGTGDASGITYDGSAVRTISWNTVGAASGNIGGYANVGLGPIGNANLLITGGLAGQVLITNGSGNLSWSSIAVSNAIRFSNVVGSGNPANIDYNGNTAGYVVSYNTVGAAEGVPTNNYAIGISNPANTTGMNPVTGSIYGSWALAAGATLNATYADLAEYYVADAKYEPGTVLEFGGEYEVTVAEDETVRVAGVVSTNPAYGMNANCNGEHVVALALQGRVPCRVRGNIRKGDMMCSGGDGYARPTHNPKIGTIIGKALENFSGEGIIEVAVGRL